MTNFTYQFSATVTEDVSGESTTWSQPFTLSGPMRSFGTNLSSFSQVSANVTGLTTAINYSAQGDAGMTSGIPNAFPGGTGDGTFPAGVTNPILDFAPYIPQTLNGSLDTVWKTFLASCPAGTSIMPYHEANSPGNIKQFGYTAADIQNLDTYVINLIAANGYPVTYGRGIATYPVWHDGTDPTPFLTPTANFFGMDGYQHTNSSQTPNTIFGGAVTAMKAVNPIKPIRIIETNSAFDNNAWIAAIWSFAQANDIRGIQSFWSSAQPWSSSYASAYQTVATAIANGE